MTTISIHPDAWSPGLRPGPGGFFRRREAQVRREIQSRAMQQPAERGGEAGALDDRELVVRALEGERAAVDSLVGRLASVRAMVRALWVRYGGRPDDNDLDDVTQEAQLAIWKRLPKFDGRVPLEGWIWGFCRNHVMKAMQRAKRHGAGGEELLEDLSDEREPEPGWALDREQLRGVLAETGEPARTILLLKHQEDLSFTEIGARLDMSSNTAKTHYYRCLAKLKLRLASFSDGDGAR